MLLWGAVTVSLGLFFTASSSFGATYGPLAGLVALLLWSLLSSVALLFGAALGAQLESVRAGASEPQDEEKVKQSEPRLESIGSVASSIDIRSSQRDSVGLSS